MKCRPGSVSKLGGRQALEGRFARQRRRERPGGRRAGRRAGQVQRAEEGQRRGAEGRGRGAEGAGDGLLLAHPRASVGRLAKPLAALPPALPLLLASEARLARARHATPSGAARAAAHSRPPQLARSVSSPQPRPSAADGAGSLCAHARSTAPCRPYPRAPLTCPPAGANRRSRSTPACRNGPLEYSWKRC